MVNREEIRMIVFNELDKDKENILNKEKGLIIGLITGMLIKNYLYEKLVNEDNILEWYLMLSAESYIDNKQIYYVTKELKQEVDMKAILEDRVKNYIYPFVVEWFEINKGRKCLGRK